MLKVEVEGFRGISIDIANCTKKEKKNGASIERRG